MNMLYQTLWPQRHFTSTIELTCSIVCPFVGKVKNLTFVTYVIGKG
jgi:hypothetical protein